MENALMTFKALHRWTNEGKILSTTVLVFPKRVNCPPHAPSTRRLTLLQVLRHGFSSAPCVPFLTMVYMLIPTLLLGGKHMTHGPCAACLQAVFLGPLSPQESREGRRKAGERCTHDVHARARGPRASRTPTLDGRKKSQHCQKETANSRRERDRAVYPHTICAFLSIFAQESRPHPRHPRQIERAPAPLNEDILVNRGPRGTMKKAKNDKERRCQA
jgi:hypothetical protein